MCTTGFNDSLYLIRHLVWLICGVSIFTKHILQYVQIFRFTVIHSQQHFALVTIAFLLQLLPQQFQFASTREC